MKNHLLIVILLVLNFTGLARAADSNSALTKPASKPLTAQPVVPASARKPVSNLPATGLAPSPEQSGNDRHKSRAVTSQDYSPMASPTPAASVHKVKVTPHQAATDTRPAPTSPVPIPYPLMKTKPDSETSKPSAKSPFAAKSKDPGLD